MKRSGELMSSPSLTSSSPPLLSKIPLPESFFAPLCFRVLPIIWLGYVLNILDRTNLGLAALQMTDDLNLTPQSFGLDGAVFFLSYGLMQVPCNHLCKKIGPVKVLAASMVAWGTISAATALVWSGPSLMVMRFLLGLAESAFYPGCLYLLTCWFPPEFRGRAVACFATATSVGGMLSTAGSGLLMEALDRRGGVRGWRWLLFLEGVPTVALGLAVPLFMSNKPRDARWLKRWPEEARERLLQALEPDERACGELFISPRLLDSIYVNLEDHRTWDFILQYGGMMMVLNCSRFSLPTQLKEALGDVPSSQVGLILTVPALMKMILSPFVARLGDRSGCKRKLALMKALFCLAALSLLVGSAAMICGLGSGRWSIALVAMCSLSDVAVQCGLPLFWSIHMETFKGEYAATNLAIVNAFGNIGGFIGPSMVGIVHDQVGPLCGVGEKCAEQWGWGMLGVGATFTMVTVMTRLERGNFVTLKKQSIRLEV